jgi:hypothetical protein
MKAPWWARTSIILSVLAIGSAAASFAFHIRGPPGVAGPAGAVGAPGAAGPRGPRGPRGYVGVSGSAATDPRVDAICGVFDNAFSGLSNFEYELIGDIRNACSK